MGAYSPGAMHSSWEFTRFQSDTSPRVFKSFGIGPAIESGSCGLVILPSQCWIMVSESMSHSVENRGVFRVLKRRLKEEHYKLVKRTICLVSLEYNNNTTVFMILFKGNSPHPCVKYPFKVALIAFLPLLAFLKLFACVKDWLRRAKRAVYNPAWLTVFLFIYFLHCFGAGSWSFSTKSRRPQRFLA